MKKHFNKIVSGTVFTLLLGSGVVFAQNIQIEKTEEAINEGVTISSNDLANNHSKIYKDEIISAADLPKEIKKYMSKHFSNAKVIKAKKEETLLGVHHELKLDNGVELEFNGKNEIIEVDGSTKLPDSVIPSSILKYVKSNYAENSIVEWKLDRNKQEVELDNGIELEFTKEGKFIRIDQ